MTSGNAVATLAGSGHAPQERRSDSPQAPSDGSRQDRRTPERRPLLHRDVADRWLPTGQTQRETFDDEGVAKRFRDLVNGHGQQWPPEWVKDEGFVKPGEPEMPD